MRIVIIGGGTAGTEVARQLRFRDKNVEIILVDKKGYNQYSPCSMPYYLEGKIKDLEVYSNYEEDKIEYLRSYELVSYDDEKVVVKKDEFKELSYDKLVLATGSSVVKPKIKGLEEYYTLKDLDDVKKLKKLSGKTLIIGGGYIGVELALALKNVTLVEAEPFLFPKTLDKDMSKLVKEYLESEGVKVITDTKVDEIKNGEFMSEKYDNFIVSVGFKPLKEYEVDEFLRVKENVYTVGDLVKSKNLVTNEEAYCMLANNAVKQASVVAENILGNEKKYEGFVSNSVSKTRDLIIGSVGVTSEKGKGFFKVVVGKFKGLSKYKSCDGKEIVVKLICNEKGIVKGCQVIGYEDVSGILNMVSSYVKNKQSVYDLVEVDTCYNPCVASMHNPLVEAGKVVVKKLGR